MVSLVHVCILHKDPFAATLTFNIPVGVNTVWVDGDEANGLANLGEITNHVCTLTNGGTTSLVSFCITSDILGDGCQECPEAETLLPGASFTCMIDTEVIVFVDLV